MAPDRGTSLQRTTRASDEERERVVARLREHYADGRLEEAELEERVARAYAARTRGELSALLRDLPRRRRRVSATRVSRAALTAHAKGYVGFNALLVATWVAAGGGVFWPAWVLVPTTAVLIMHARLHRRVTRRARRRALRP